MHIATLISLAGPARERPGGLSPPSTARARYWQHSTGLGPEQPPLASARALLPFTAGRGRFSSQPRRSARGSSRGGEARLTSGRREAGSEERTAAAPAQPRRLRHIRDPPARPPRGIPRRGHPCRNRAAPPPFVVTRMGGIFPREPPHVPPPPRCPSTGASRRPQHPLAALLASRGSGEQILVRFYVCVCAGAGWGWGVGW